MISKLNYPQVGLFILAWFLADLLTPLVIHLAHKIGAVDKPHSYKIHQLPVPFLGGVDHYIPADARSRGTVTIRLTPRGDEHAARVLNVPNHPSSMISVSVQLHDFEMPTERSGRFRRVPLR